MNGYSAIECAIIAMRMMFANGGINIDVTFIREIVENGSRDCIKTATHYQCKFCYIKMPSNANHDDGTVVSSPVELFVAVKPYFKLVKCKRAEKQLTHATEATMLLEPTKWSSTYQWSRTFTYAPTDVDALKIKLNAMFVASELSKNDI